MDTIKMKSEEGPWERLDPDKLKREAELKEQKVVRKKAAAEARTAARRERRHEKGAAKAARRANVTRAAKWNEERRALDKQKKIANRPAKEEKRRLRMVKRAEKLEEQAKKLWTEAQKARARFAYLTALKEKEDAEKEKVLQELEKEQKTATDEYIPLDVDGDAGDLLPISRADGKANGVPSFLSERSTKATAGTAPATATAQTQVAPKAEPVEDEEAEVNGLDSGHAKSIGEDADDGGVQLENGAVNARTTEKAKKKKGKKKTVNFESEDAGQNGVDSKTNLKKEMKRKWKEQSDAESEHLNGDTEQVETQPRKKEKKDKKRKRDEDAAQEVAAEEGVPSAEQPTSKKSKKEKKPKKEKRAGKEQADQETYGTSASDTLNAKADKPGQWDVSGLSGGTARQEKFLKLLGGEKHGLTSATTAVGQSERNGRVAVQDELERQFEEGTRMKSEGRGQHRGLGA